MHYDYVGDVIADDLEDAFGKMNRRDGNENFTDFTPHSEFKGGVRSLSVGDVLRVEDQWFSVDNIGFSELDPSFDENVEQRFIEPFVKTKGMFS